MARQRGGAFGEGSVRYFSLISIVLGILGLGLLVGGLTSKDPDHDKRDTMAKTGWTIMMLAIIAGIVQLFFGSV